MPKAIKVRPDNIWYIIAYGKELHMNLEHIRDQFEIATQVGAEFEFYVVTDGTLEANNVTFTEVYASTFGDYWKFTKPEQPYEFVEIEKV
jgi:hypothetical protein